MKSHVKLSVLLALFALAFVQPVASADPPISTIQGNARVEYRFDYLGDGSQILVLLAETDPASLDVSIYTSEKFDELQGGQDVQPTGRGTPNRPDSLQWSGAFRFKGTFYVVVQNRAQVPITYRMTIAGDGVSSAARAQPAWTGGSTSHVEDQNGRNVLVVNLPAAAITTTLNLVMPPQPDTCTPPGQVPDTINSSIKLCPNGVYSPLNIVGDNVALYADDAGTARVTSSGRQFAITAEGSNDWIDGVTIQAHADPQDAGAWLCLYDQCDFATQPVTTTLNGGIRYGGGILLKGSNSVVHGVTVLSGTIGIATVDGLGNKIIGNKLSGLNGWGSFNIKSAETYFVGNTFDDEDHGCTAPDGRTFLHGCETSGWVCLGCAANLVAYNQCALSSNCFYMSGDRQPSNDNNFFSNYCAGASANCFEITFSFGNVLRDNIATIEPVTDTPCHYPFWIGGSVSFFANNTWECTVAENDAFNQSRDSTIVPTNIIRLDNALGALNAPKIILPTITAIPFDDGSPTATATAAPPAVPTQTPVGGDGSD